MLLSKIKQIGMIVMLCFLSSCSPALASTHEYFNKVVDSIYLAEGGSKAKVPYGILSVKVHSKAEARKVCYNTVRNNYTRWLNAGKPGSFLSFLQSRYAPTNAHPLNRNWLKNVTYFMEKTK